MELCDGLWHAITLQRNQFLLQRTGPLSMYTRLHAQYHDKFVCNICLNQMCMQPLLPVARVNLRASAPYLAMTSSGSSTLPRVLDILRPCSSLTCMVETDNMGQELLTGQTPCIHASDAQIVYDGGPTWDCQVCSDQHMTSTHVPSPKVGRKST